MLTAPCAADTYNVNNFLFQNSSVVTGDDCRSFPASRPSISREADPVLGLCAARHRVQ